MQRKHRNKFGDKPGHWPEQRPKQEARYYANGKLEPTVKVHNVGAAKLPMGNWMALGNEGPRRKPSVPVPRKPVEYTGQKRDNTIGGLRSWGQHCHYEKPVKVKRYRRFSNR